MFNFFKRKLKPPKDCNYHLAARVIGKTLELWNKQAHDQGGYWCWPKEADSAWKEFATNPCYETSNQLLNVAPEFLRFFMDCRPNGKFYRKGFRTAADFTVGDYRLNMNLEDIDGLREATKEEYLAFRRASAQEFIYYAPPTRIAGCDWTVFIRATEGKMKLIGASLNFSAKGAEKEIPKLIQTVLEDSEIQLGTPTEETRGLISWDTETGKVAFAYAVFTESDGFAANIFVGDLSNFHFYDFSRNRP